MSDKVKERIEKEAIAYSNLRVWPTKEIREYIQKSHYDGATAERPKAWNEAIDACIAVARSTGSNGMAYKKFLQAEFEKLKHKQP